MSLSPGEQAKLVLPGVGASKEEAKSPPRGRVQSRQRQQATRLQELCSRRALKGVSSGLQANAEEQTKLLFILGQSRQAAGGEALE